MTERRDLLSADDGGLASALDGVTAVEMSIDVANLGAAGTPVDANTMILDQGGTPKVVALSDLYPYFAETYRTTFTNASLVDSVLTITHNLGEQYVLVEIWDMDDVRIPVTDKVTATGVNTCTVDLSPFGPIGGTWHAVARK